MAKKPVTLSEELLKLETVEFTRERVEMLPDDLIEKLLANWDSDRENPKSLGYRFIIAVQTLYRQGIILQTAENAFDLKESVAHTIKVIAQRSEARDGMVRTGTRRDPKIFYVYTVEELEEKEPSPRDPFSPNKSVEQGFTNLPYDIELYAEDGTAKVSLDVQAALVMAWTTHEFPDGTKMPSIEAILKQNPGVGVEALTSWIPQAVAMFYAEKRKARTNWDKVREKYLEVQPTASAPDLDPDPAYPGGNPLSLLTDDVLLKMGCIKILNPQHEQRLHQLQQRLAEAQSGHLSGVEQVIAEVNALTGGLLHSTLDNLIFEALRTKFSLAEIHTVCFKAGIPWEEIPGTTLTTKAVEMSTYAAKHTMTSLLVQAMSSVFWP